MPQYLYRIQPTRIDMLAEGPTPEEADSVKRHFAYLQRLLAEGSLILAGRTLNSGETSFGIVIFNAEDEAAAETILRSDPAIIDGVMRGEVFPYGLALISEANSRA